MSATETENDASTVAKFLADHPKMTGMLFAALLMLSQAGLVVGGGSAYSGP